MHGRSAGHTVQLGAGSVVTPLRQRARQQGWQCTPLLLFCGLADQPLAPDPMTMLRPIFLALRHAADPA
jgi:hypothetical protein